MEQAVKDQNGELTPAQGALKRAIDAAGGQQRLADAIGTTQSQVSYWLTSAKKGVAADFVLKIEEATGIPRHEMRPDVYPAPMSLPPETPDPTPAESAT